MKLAILPVCLSLAVLLVAVGCGLRPHDPADDERPRVAFPRDADPARGKEVAVRWCVACHLVAQDMPIRPEQAGAPSFLAIALDPAKDARHLARVLDEVPPPMPTYRLFPEEKLDLLAYLATLRAPR